MKARVEGSAALREYRDGFLMTKCAAAHATPPPLRPPRCAPSSTSHAPRRLRRLVKSLEALHEDHVDEMHQKVIGDLVGEVERIADTVEKKDEL